MVKLGVATYEILFVKTVLKQCLREIESVRVQYQVIGLAVGHMTILQAFVGSISSKSIIDMLPTIIHPILARVTW